MNCFLATAMGDHTIVLLTLFIMLVRPSYGRVIRATPSPAVAGEIWLESCRTESSRWGAPSEIHQSAAEIGVISPVSVGWKPNRSHFKGQTSCGGRSAGVVAHSLVLLLMRAWVYEHEGFVGTAMLRHL